jgi:hypothetical protein
MALFYFIFFLEKYLKFLWCPPCPQIEKNSYDHHNSYNNNPNLAFFSFIESPSNSSLTINSQKINSPLHITATCPKQAKALIWPPKSFRDWSLDLKGYLSMDLDCQWNKFGFERIVYVYVLLDWLFNNHKVFYVDFVVLWNAIEKVMYNNFLLLIYF